MEQYIQYILEKDKELIFNPETEAQVIQTILGDTDGYQPLQAEHNGNIEWVVREDIDLARFSFQMFIRSKKIMLVDITHEDFIILWDNYTHTQDYFIQVANYMLNSNDYTSGARIQLESEEKQTSEFPEPNLQENMRNLQGSFQGNPIEESQYVQKVGRIGSELLQIIR
ncbi:MAG TPA: hypothetical protein VFC62_01195 [Atopostipes sp.]|nr:hypothetical protein [Atopostipes sp.]